MNHMISCIAAVNTKEYQQPVMLKKWIVVRMANAQCRVMMEKIVVKKKVLQKWIVVKMVNAPRKDMMEKTVAKIRTVIINPLITHL